MSARRRCWTVPGGADGIARVLEVFGPERVRFAEVPRPDLAPRNALLQRFEDELKLARYSPRTRKSYLAHARRFLGQLASCEVIGAQELRSYVLTLADERFSHAYHVQAVSALRLFAAGVLRLPQPEYALPRPRREKKLPKFLSADEVRGVLATVSMPYARMSPSIAPVAGCLPTPVARAPTVCARSRRCWPMPAAAHSWRRR